MTEQYCRLLKVLVWKHVRGQTGVPYLLLHAGRCALCFVGPPFPKPCGIDMAMSSPSLILAAKLGRQVAHMHLAAPQHDHGAQFGFECDNTIGGTPQPNPWEDDWVEFFRKHRLRHQLGLAGNSRLNSLAEPLLQPGALEKFFDGVEVKPSVLHGADSLVVAVASAGDGPGISNCGC